MSGGGSRPSGFREPRVGGVVNNSIRESQNLGSEGYEVNERKRADAIEQGAW